MNAPLNVYDIDDDDDELEESFERNEKTMTALMDLENDVNDIAKAIAAALKVDVEITDTDLVKVAVVVRGAVG